MMTVSVKQQNQVNYMPIANGLKPSIESGIPRFNAVVNLIAASPGQSSWLVRVTETSVRISDFISSIYSVRTTSLN